MSPQETGWNILRWLYGMLFLATGVWIWTVVGGLVSPPAQPTTEAAEFMDAMRATKFMNPLMALSFLLGGGALLLKRSAPLGLVVLAPSIATIIFFHVTLTGQVAWPILFALWSAALFWRFRRGFTCLWLFSDAKRPS